MQQPETAVDTGAEFVRHFSGARHLATMPLPDFGESAEKKDWFQKLIEKGLEQLREWFREENRLPTRDHVILGVEILATLIVCAIVYALVFYFVRRKPKKKGAPRFFDDAPAIKEEWLTTEIASSLKDLDWPRAARLRWKLFLKKEKLRADVTPIEFFSDRTELTDPAEFPYQLMFRVRAGSAEKYSLWNETLEGVEESLAKTSGTSQ